MHTVFWPRNVMGRVYSENLGIDERIILKWMEFVT
jgi:hypothetical protein